MEILHTISRITWEVRFVVVLVVTSCCYYYGRLTQHPFVLVSRTTVSKTISRCLPIIVEKLGVKPFPLDDPDKLEELAQGFRSKSCGKLFRNVVGAFDGYLLRISRKCLSKQANVKKYYCRKQFHAVNCQVGCDADRRIIYLSIMCPGATPDILAHCAGPLHGVILVGKLDVK